MPNERVYIHEFIDIIGHNRANYMHHMAANFSPHACRERGQLCFGVWGTVGSTGRWPEVVNLWEEQGWDGLAASFGFELSHPTLQDPALAEWWATAARFRRGGYDRILVPGAWTRTIEELCAAGVRGVCYAHEVISVRPDTAWHYIDDLVRHVQVPTYARYDWELVGAFVTAMRDESEAIVIWAIPSWDHWSALERATGVEHEVQDWRAQQATVSTHVERVLLVDAPLSPMRTGRQPQDSDRDAFVLAPKD
jgi:hypothetical protein